MFKTKIKSHLETKSIKDLTALAVDADIEIPAGAKKAEIVTALMTGIPKKDLEELVRAETAGEEKEGIGRYLLNKCKPTFKGITKFAIVCAVGFAGWKLGKAGSVTTGDTDESPVPQDETSL